MEQDLSLYSIFYTVARNGSISGAAKELFITQPAVSKSVHRLEKHLRYPLFFRNPRGVTLTNEGKKLYGYVEQALTALQMGEASLNCLSDTLKGVLRIGTTTTLCRKILTPYLKKFAKKYPQVQISLGIGTSEQIHQDIAENKFDVGLICQSVLTEKMEFCSLGQLNDVFVANKTYYKGVGSNKVKNKKKMFKGTLILVKGEIINREELDNYLQQNFITVQNVIVVNSTAALIELTKQGMGIGFVAKEFISQEIRNKELLVVLSNFKKAPLSTGLIRKQQALCNPVANKFWEMIKIANKEK